MSALAQPVTEMIAEEDIRREALAHARTRLAAHVGILQSLSEDDRRAIAETAPIDIRVGSRELSQNLDE